MNATTTIAIAKGIAAKEITSARDSLAPGTYEIDQTVRIVGSFTVAEDTEKTPTVSIPLKEVLALFIARSGITREASMKLLSEALTDAMTAGTKGEGFVAAASDIDAAFKQQTESLLCGLPKTKVKGAVKTTVTIMEVSR